MVFQVRVSTTLKEILFFCFRHVHTIALKCCSLLERIMLGHFDNGYDGMKILFGAVYGDYMC